ncbi:MAG: hypothetical protein ACUVRP_03200 [Chlorobiales bacterium]
MHPDQLECELIDKLKTLPETKSRRLLYNIIYDSDKKDLIKKTAKNLLAGNPFPLLPSLIGHQLTILAAFALEMADDEYAELDSFYNRLSEIFFSNLPLDNSRQNEIRDFVEKTCHQYNLLFLKTQHRLVRNTIWLHGGLPSRHWNRFFECVLMKVDDSLENLDELLQIPTPKTIRRFFEHCNHLAKRFLNDCIQMRNALNESDAETYSADDFGVSKPFFEAFKSFQKYNQPTLRLSRPQLSFDERNLKVTEQPNGNEATPQQKWYAFRTNRKLISKCQTELPQAQVIVVHHKDFSIDNSIPRYAEPESLLNAWKDYRCEWIDLGKQESLTLIHQKNPELNKEIEVVSMPSVTLIGEKLTLNNWFLQKRLKFSKNFSRAR